MKNINKYSYILVFTLALLLPFSCVNEEDLNVSEFNVISEDNLDPEALVIAAYSALDYRFNTGDFRDLWPFDHAPSNWATSDIRSGDAYKGGGGTGDNPGGGIHQLETHDVFPSSENVYNLWRSIHFGLKRVDAAIRFVKDLDQSSFSNRNVRLGELYTLRAHFYFEAMKNFGSIVWYDENTPLADLGTISNTFDTEFIWDKIETDLRTAIDLLPDTQEDLGRVNGIVAKAYLAKAHLFQEEWTEVITYTNDIISSQYGLVDDIERLYSEPGYGNMENIFAIQFSINDGSQFGNLNFGDLLNSPDSPGDDVNHPYLNGDDFHKPSQNLANAFKVDANGLPLFSSFNNENVDDEDLLDPRIDHVIGRPGVTWKDWTPQPQQENWSRDIGTYGVFVRKKNMIYPSSDGVASNPNGFPWAQGNLDFPLIKYSDALLWRAEALIESGQDIDGGVSLINLIRQRALNSPRVKDFNHPNHEAANYNIGLYPMALSQVQAREALRFERRLELANEGHRFYDLVRWGIATQYINEYISIEQNRRGYLAGASLQEHEQYLPIPQIEIDASGGVYVQRQGY